MTKTAKKFTSTVAGASILLTGIGLMSRGLGLVREMVFAGSFGLSKQYDLYLVGVVIPITINTMVLYLAQNYFIPNYNRFKSSSQDKAIEFTRNSIFIFSLIGIGICIVLYFSSNLITTFYLGESSAASLKIPSTTLKILSLTIPINAAYSILAAYFYAELNFSYPAFSQLFLNLSIIFLVVFFSTSLGILAIPVGYFMGTVLQIIFLIIKVKNKINLKIREILKSDWLKLNSNKGLILTIIIETFGQLYLIIDRYFYSQVSAGSLSALNYAMVLFLLPISIFSMAFTTAIFPNISKMVHTESLKSIEGRILRFIKFNLILFTPITLIMFFDGKIIIKILFEHGKFVDQDTLLTYNLLKVYVVSMLFYSVYGIINKILYSFSLLRILFLISLFTIFLKFVLNFTLVTEYQVYGLAFATSMCYVTIVLISIYILKNKTKIFVNNAFIKELIFNLSNGILSYGIADLFSEFMNMSLFYQSIVRILIFILIYSINLIILRNNIVSVVKTTYFSYRRV